MKRLAAAGNVSGFGPVLAVSVRFAPFRTKSVRFGASQTADRDDPADCILMISYCCELFHVRSRVRTGRVGSFAGFGDGGSGARTEVAGAGVRTGMARGVRGQHRAPPLRDRG
jgi:hypothetical protein